MMTGGGTGGHMFPLIAVARELEEISYTAGFQIRFILVGPEMKKDISREDHFIYRHLITGKLRRYLSFKTILDIFKTIIGFIQAFYYMLLYKPDIIFSKGGYGSFPTVVIGWLFRIPVISHESDSVPGAANRLLSIFSKKIIVSFPGEYDSLPNKKIEYIGNPMRQMDKGIKSDALKEFSLIPDKPTLLIIGGSQGSHQINMLVQDILPELTDKYQIIHQVGKNKLPELDKEFKNYHMYEFLNENGMKNAYAAADLVISRAGAGSIFEIAMTGKPSILIPLKHDPSNHQKENAKRYAEAGACIVLDPRKVLPRTLLENINDLMNNQDKRDKMSKAAKAFAKPDAAKKIAEFILNYSGYEK